MHTLVIGAGVSGLTAAIRLLEAGHSVEIWARELPTETTSAIAAAIWYPYRAEPAERVLAWGDVSFQEFLRLSDDPETGVVMRHGLEVFRKPAEDPWWKSAVPDFRRADADELPPGFADGYATRLPVIDMSVYLPWLARRVESDGARIERRTVRRLDEVLGEADLVVDCMGLGAKAEGVFADESLYSVRGQIQVVRAPGVSTFLIHDEEGEPLTYIIPRTETVVLGGTSERDQDDTAVDPATTADIRQRCIQVMPELADAPVLANRAGLRPCRPTVRLEAEEIEGTRVIHNVGHGGSGVTLSWGCADEVVRLV